MATRKRIQYQAKAGPVLDQNSQIAPKNVGPSNDINIFYKSKTQYQAYAAPIAPPVVEVITEDKWHQCWSEPVRQRIAPALAIALIASGVFFTPTQPSPDKLESSWHQPWSRSVRTKIDPRLSVALSVSGMTAPPFALGGLSGGSFSNDVTIFYRSRTQYQAYAAPIAPTIEVITEDKWHQPWSEPVRTRLFQVSEQKIRTSAFVPTVETITADKWLYPWSEPVRQKPGLIANLQQAFIGTVLNPETQISQNYESRWHYSWSEPVRTRQLSVANQTTFFATFIPTAPTPGAGVATSAVSSQIIFNGRLIYQSLAYAPFTPAEVITPDKWFVGLSEPVRQRPGLQAHLQQAFIGTTLNPEAQIAQGYESRWHQPWSEPKRFKPQLPVNEQQFFIAPAFVPEVITADKWIYPWSEPVRIKPALLAGLQQAYPSFVLNPDTQITQGYESRWHQPWSEPVRFRRFPTAEQRVFEFQPPSFEIINADKWIYPLSEPVRQKQGLRAHLQQFLIATTLNPETQIVQDYESRWHQGWSEPVRFRVFGTALQQAIIQPATSVFETITEDKWHFPWSEPVRQKQGLKAHLQQALIATTLNPETQIIQDYESRWHQPWSEPRRFKPHLPASEQQFFAAPALVAETITADKWIYPWSEPVRVKLALAASEQQFLAIDTATIPVSKLEPWFVPFSEPVRQPIGLKAYLQQFIVQTVLNPETQIIQDYESRWHFAWSEPVRFRVFNTALQQFLIQPATSVFETITEDKWHFPWSEPVRQKPGLRANLQQFLVATTLNPETQIIQGIESRWHYPWSEPVRQKIGLRPWLQQTTILATPPFPTFVKTINWYQALSEPKRFKQWIHPARVPFFWTTPESILSDITLTLSATEVNSDSAIFGIVTYTQVAPTVAVNAYVSIKEIPVIRVADVSTEEIPAIRKADVSVEELQDVNNASASIKGP